MTFVFPILAIVFLFGLSIFVHELGHFLAARALGMVADVFSIGMGPALWKRKAGGTVWKIGAIPFGGYVALPQMAPNSILEGDGGDAGSEARDLPAIAPWRKIVVALAGAAGNFVFAFLLAAVVWVAGKPSSLQELNAVIGYVAEDSSAAAAGLAPGDEVIALNQRPVATWLDLSEAAALAPNDEVTLRVRTVGGDERDIVLELVATDYGLRVLPGLAGQDPCHVAALMPGLGAEQAGIQPGDQILRYGDQEIHSRAHLSQLVEGAGTEPVEVTVRRGGRELVIPVAARYDEDSQRHLLGIQFNILSDLDFTTRSHPTPWAQVKSHAGSIFRVLRALATPSTSGAAAGAVGGPIFILMMLWLMIKSSFILGLWFTGLLNVNLAIINLLPVPILDGGHVVMNLYEWIARRPPPARVLNFLAHAFAVLFIALFLALTFRDSVRHLLPPLRHWFGG